MSTKTQVLTLKKPNNAYLVKNTVHALTIYFLS